MKAKNYNNESNLKNSKENKKNINIAEDLEKLRKLYIQGILNREEFDKAKDKLINS